MQDAEISLQKLSFWEHLSAAEKDEMISASSLVRYEKGSTLRGKSNTCLGMVCVIRGCLRAYLLSEEGREVTLFRLKEGDVCVLTASCVMHQITFDTQIAAEKRTDAVVISSGVVQRLMEKNIYVRCFLYETATERFSSVMWSMQQILFSRMDQRIAEYLIREYERTGDTELHITHEQLAVQISSAREVVARMLKRFVADGLVGGRRGVIELLDIDGLRALL